MATAPDSGLRMDGSIRNPVIQSASNWPMSACGTAYRHRRRQTSVVDDHAARMRSKVSTY